MDQKDKHKSKNNAILRRKHEIKPYECGLGNGFFSLFFFLSLVFLKAVLLKFNSYAILFLVLLVAHCVCWLFATPWIVASQAALSMGFPRQEYWSGLPFPPPEDLPDRRIEPGSSCMAGRFFTIWATREAHKICLFKICTGLAYLQNCTTITII